MNKLEWIYCPLCKHKTRTKIRKDTELIHFPLYCPKCRKETLINVKELNLTKMKSLTLRRRANNFEALTLQNYWLFYIKKESY